MTFLQMQTYVCFCKLKYAKGCECCMVLLEAKNIQKHFGGVAALSDGNITCREGRITGLLGANGTGKSTISKIITGVYLADGGTITYKGETVSFKNPIDAKRAGIAMAFQNLSLLPDLTVMAKHCTQF